MKLVVQRVTSASVKVDDETIGQIDNGLMVLVGFGENDTQKEADYLSQKLLKLRIFADESGHMNKSAKDIEGKPVSYTHLTLPTS